MLTNAIRKNVNRPVPTGKARVARNVMAFTILFATFLLFQYIQVQKMGDALYNLVYEAKGTTKTTTESHDKSLDALKAKFPGTDKFLTDPVFSQSVMNDRIDKDISVQLASAKQDTEFSTQGIFLYPVFKYVLPNAQSTVDTHIKNIDEFFHGEIYTDYATVDRNINDTNAAIAHCNGTATEKNNFGWIGQDKDASADQKAEQAKLIQQAADRTICADKDAFKAANPVAAK